MDLLPAAVYASRVTKRCVATLNVQLPTSNSAAVQYLQIVPFGKELPSKKVQVFPQTALFSCIYAKK